MNPQENPFALTDVQMNGEVGNQSADTELLFPLFRGLNLGTAVIPRPVGESSVATTARDGKGKLRRKRNRDKHMMNAMQEKKMHGLNCDKCRLLHRSCKRLKVSVKRLRQQKAKLLKKKMELTQFLNAHPLPQ